VTVANVNLNLVGPGFAEALGMQVARGREFAPADDYGGVRVAIVNEAFVARLELDPLALGTKVGFQDGDGSLDFEIVGVFRDAAYRQVREPPPPVLFLPWRQSEELPSLTYYVRSPRAATEVMAGIRTAVRGIAPEVPLERLRTMPEQIREVMLQDLLLSRLSTALALLATALATLGLYGMMAHSVAERSKEIGVRIALGAGLRRIRVMVVQRALRAVAIGGGIGLLGAYIIGRAMEALLFQTNGTDPRVFTVSVAVLGFAAAFAAYIPARRASSLDPMVALRSD
jgi:hypothetical protein